MTALAHAPGYFTSQDNASSCFPSSKTLLKTWFLRQLQNCASRIMVHQFSHTACIRKTLQHAACVLRSSETRLSPVQEGCAGAQLFHTWSACGCLRSLGCSQLNFAVCMKVRSVKKAKQLAAGD